MSREAVVTFLKKLDDDEALRNAFSKAVPEEQRDAERVVAFAGKHGLAFTADELQEEAKGHALAEGGGLTEEQLDSVVGGLSYSYYGAYSTRLLTSVYSLASRVEKVYE